MTTKDKEMIKQLTMQLAQANLDLAKEQAKSAKFRKDFEDSAYWCGHWKRKATMNAGIAEVNYQTSERRKEMNEARLRALAGEGVQLI